jgi:hypothetical protein
LENTRNHFLNIKPHGKETQEITLKRACNADPLIHILGKYLPMNSYIASHALMAQKSILFFTYVP